MDQRHSKKSVMDVFGFTTATVRIAPSPAATENLTSAQNDVSLTPTLLHELEALIHLITYERLAKFPDLVKNPGGEFCQLTSSSSKKYSIVWPNGSCWTTDTPCQVSRLKISRVGSHVKEVPIFKQSSTLSSSKIGKRAAVMSPASPWPISIILSFFGRHWSGA